MRHLTAFAALAGLALAVSTAMADEKEKEKYESVNIGPVTYQVPKEWQRQRPSDQMRTLQYGVPLAEGDRGKLEMVVFYFGGGGGSVQDNLRRWVGFFQEKDEEEKIETMEVSGMKVTTLDITGTYAAPFGGGGPQTGTRMLAAIVETGDGPYFFRMVGPKKSVTAQDDAWNHMLKSAKPR